jgi:hypothetical protein
MPGTPALSVRLIWLLAVFGLAALVPLGSVPAAERIEQGEGRIAWDVGAQSALPSRYVRQSGRSSVCDIALWDTATHFARVTYCETLSGWYWKPAYMSYDLMMDDFGQLRDFITVGPEPFREVVTKAGLVDFYGFDVDRTSGDDVWQCFGFIKGFNREDRGFQQMLIVYFCDDTGQGMTDARFDEVLRGLSIDGVFASFVE